MIYVEDFASLTEEIDSLFNEVASRKVAQSVGLQIYDVFDTNRRTYDHQIFHGMSGIQKIAEGGDIPKITSNEGDNISWTQSTYAVALSVTKDMRMYDLHDQILGLVKSVTDDAFDKIDQSLADRLLGGQATTYTDPYRETVSTLGPDGLKLFHTGHTNNVSSETFRNVCIEGATSNPELSRKAIVDTRVEAASHRDPNNILRPINLDTLVVPRNLEDTALRLINSQYLPGSGNNDINPLYNKIKVIVWDRLALNSDGIDTSDYWFMYDSTGVKESLKCIFAERPSLDAPEQVYINKNWDWTLDYRYTIGTGYPAYIWGSNGTGAFS